METNSVGKQIDLVSSRGWAMQDRLLWHGRIAEVLDVAQLAPNYQQVVLRFLDHPDAFPLSLPASDLVDAERLEPVERTD